MFSYHKWDQNLTADQNRRVEEMLRADRNSYELKVCLALGCVGATLFALTLAAAQML